MSDTCATGCKNPQVIAESREKISDYRNIERTADFYKLFGNQTRLKIMLVLMGAELCVCDIAESIELSIPATSQQLKMLKQARILTQRNSGKTVYYSFADPKTEELADSLMFDTSGVR